MIKRSNPMARLVWHRPSSPRWKPGETSGDDAGWQGHLLRVWEGAGRRGSRRGLKLSVAMNIAKKRFLITNSGQSWTGFIWIYMILYSCLKSLSMRWYMVFRLKFGMSSATFVTRSSHHTSVVTQTTIGLNKHHTQEIRCVTVATSRVSVEGAGYSTNLSQGWPREPRNDRWLVKALIVGRSPVHRGVMRFGWTSMIVVTLW